MKKILIFLLLVGFSFPAAATTYTGSGNIQLLRTHDSIIGTDVDWMLVDGFSDAGSCGKSRGLVVLRIKDDEKGKRQYSTALSAYMAGKPVFVNVKDTETDSTGNCFLMYIGFE